MNEYTVKLTYDATNDINDLMSYYADLTGDDESGKNLEQAIRTTIESLKTFPNGNPMWDDDPSVRRVNLKKRRVAIIYVVNDDKLEVIAAQVFHALGDPKNVRKLIRERLDKIAE
jgi:plasmid stabilization system protein ParE